MSELDRIEKLSDWYRNEQLDFDGRLIEFRYRSIKPFLTGKKGCELGPAEGQMTRFLIDDFDSLTVVDGAKSLLAQIPDHPKLTKIHSLFEDYQPTSNFDTVIMEHILEHVEAPVELLRKVAAWINRTNGSRLIIGVPNASSFHRLAAVKMGLLSKPDELNSRDIALGHRRVYSRELLQADIKNAGLRVIEMGGVFMKPLSNGQIEAHWTNEMIEAFFELGKDFQEHAAEIFAVVEPA